MLKRGTQAELYLNGKPAGVVQVQSSDNSWHFGRFEPAAGFSEFAPTFGRWALLMHEDSDRSRMSRDVLDELRRTEEELSRIRAKLRISGKEEWREIAMINIDGGLVEWKEY